MSEYCSCLYIRHLFLLLVYFLIKDSFSTMDSFIHSFNCYELSHFPPTYYRSSDASWHRKGCTYWNYCSYARNIDSRKLDSKRADSWWAAHRTHANLRDFKPENASSDSLTTRKSDANYRFLKLGLWYYFKFSSFSLVNDLVPQNSQLCGSQSPYLSRFFISHQYTV